MSQQSQTIVAHLLEPTRFAKLAAVAKAASNLPSNEHAETVVNYEAAFYGARLAAIDLDKHQLPIERAQSFFLEVIQTGMSFSPEANHVYLAPDFQNTSRLSMMKTADGNIFLAQKAGSISHVTRPVMVYAGDTFRIGTNNEGRQIVVHEAQIAQAGASKGAIIAGYVFVIFPRGDREPYWMDQSDIDRIRAKSKRPAMYTSFNGGIDPGFFASKLINHGLKNVRKIPFYSAPDPDEEFETFDETSGLPAQTQGATPPPYTTPAAPPPAPVYQMPPAPPAATPPPPPAPIQQAPPPHQYAPVTQNQMPWTPPVQPQQSNGVQYAEPF